MLDWLDTHQLIATLIAILVLLIVVATAARSVITRLDQRQPITRHDLDTFRHHLVADLTTTIRSEHESTRTTNASQHDRTRRRVERVFEYPQAYTGDLPAQATQPATAEHQGLAGVTDVNPIVPGPATGPIGPHPTVQDGYDTRSRPGERAVPTEWGRR